MSRLFNHHRGGRQGPLLACGQAAVAAGLLCCFLSGTVLGAGFSIYEQGAKALGMGGAFAAVADDPSAMFYNPAGLATIEGRQLYAGPSFIIVPARDFAGVNPYPGFGVTAETTSDLFFPTNAYYVQPLNDQWKLGLFFNSPFGLKVEWDNPASFPGRYISTRSEITPFFFGPSIGWAVSDQIQLGGGLTFVHSKVRLEQYIPQIAVGLDSSPLLDVGTVKLEASNDVAVGFSFGALVEPSDSFRLGFGYRHEVEADYEGDADFTQISTGDPVIDALAAAKLRDQAAKTTFKFPTQWSVGVASTAVENWTFAFDLSWTDWSTFDRLKVEFASPELDLDRPQEWDSALNYRAGAEWQFRPDLALRFGGYYDENPQPDASVSPLLPDADRVGITVGFGKDWGQYTLDVYNLAIAFDERSTNGANRDDFNGTYKSFADIVGFDLGVRF